MKGKPEQLPLALGHRVALGVEDFLVADSNRHAVDWIDRWPDWPFSTLILIGPPGSGKTHLTQLWRARSRATIVDPDTLGVEQAATIAEDSRAALVDDAERVAGHRSTETALLHLYNVLRAAGGHLVLMARRPPRDWQLALRDLSSRLNSAMVVTIDAPDDELLAAVALKLFADRQIAVGPEIIPLLLTQGERSFAALTRAIDAIDRAALIAKRPVTIALVRSVLRELA